MRLLVDENVIPAHVSALDSAGHDVHRSDDLIEKGAPDADVIDLARRENYVLLTYDRKDFADMTDHRGILLATEEVGPRDRRSAVGRIERAYPDLEGVVEYVSDWT